jgi:hypothetical protein
VPTIWCIYVDGGSAENFEIALSRGVWGARRAATLGGIEEGDCALFVQGVAPGAGLAAAGWPRLKTDAFRDAAPTAARVVRAAVTSPIFRDSAPIWPKYEYEHRFSFSVISDDEHVALVLNLTPDELEAVRLSLIASGRAYRVGPPSPAQGARAKPHEEAQSDEVSEADKEAEEAGHTRAQWQLARMAQLLGLEVWLPREDRHRVHSGQRLGELSVAELPAIGLSPLVQATAQHIDVLWILRKRVRCAFEVEHSTSVYSGLLRLADLVAQQYTPIDLFVVSDEKRREKVRRELARPVFAGIGLSEKCHFLPYGALDDYLSFTEQHGRLLEPNAWIARLAEEGHA